MISLRERAAEIFGKTGDFSVLRDVFSYGQGRRPVGVEHSLREQLDLWTTRYVDLDFIRVGTELFDAGRERRIDGSLGHCRMVLGKIGLGVRRVWHGSIPLAQTDGLEHIENACQFRRLLRKWRGPNDDAVDVFFVSSIFNNAGGRARINNASSWGCNKSSSYVAGCAIDIHPVGPLIGFGVTLAHELGHHCTLRHVDLGDFFNLMHPAAGNASQELTDDQAKQMLAHCSVRSPPPR